MKNNADENISKELCNKHNVTYISQFTKKSKSNKSEKWIQFTCDKHQKYGIQERKTYDFHRLKKICKYCNHSALKEIFKEEIAEINPNIEILSDYVNWNTKIKCKCKIDGNEWEGRPSVLLYGGGCKICGHKKRWDSRGRKTTDEFIQEMKKINKNIEIIGEYKGSHEMIECKCKIDGQQWKSLACNLLNKTANCPKCASHHIREVEALTQDEFELRVGKANENIEVIGKYQNTLIPIKFKCKIHNCIFETSPRTFLYKGGIGCPHCIQSKGERKMISILENMGLNISKQHTFDDCKNIHKLRFDAYDVDNNIAYEYQGEQHYYPIDFAGHGTNWAKQQFDIIKLRDNIKKNFCKKKNIPLIEIPYWEYDTMEKYIKNKIV